MADEKIKPDAHKLDDVAGAESEQYRSALHRYLTRLLGSAEDARDLAQEAYVRFLQLPRKNAIARPRAYVFRIATNLVYEFSLGRDRKHLPYDAEIASQNAESESLDPADKLAEEEQLNRVLMQIPAAYRRVLILHKRDGLTYQEIADETGLSKQSVRKYIARAIAYGRRAKWD